MSRPIKPRMAAPVDTYSSSPTAMFLDIPKEDIRPARRMPRMEIIDE
jgi:hypothetical protein